MKERCWIHNFIFFFFFVNEEGKNRCPKNKLQKNNLKEGDSHTILPKYRGRLLNKSYRVYLRKNSLLTLTLEAMIKTPCFSLQSISHANIRHKPTLPISNMISNDTIAARNTWSTVSNTIRFQLNPSLGGGFQLMKISLCYNTSLSLFLYAPHISQTCLLKMLT